MLIMALKSYINSTVRNLLDNAGFPIDYFDLSRNPSVTWSALLSYHPNITWPIVVANPHIKWSYANLSYNPHITWAIMSANPDKPWDYHKAANSKK